VGDDDDGPLRAPHCVDAICHELERVDVQARIGFVEDRQLRSEGAGHPNVLVLRRESELPIMRVSPAEYADVAADLRRVDGAEQEEIRIRLGGSVRGGGR